MNDKWLHDEKIFFLERNVSLGKKQSPSALLNATITVTKSVIMNDDGVEIKHYL